MEIQSSSDWDNYKQHFIDFWDQGGVEMGRVVFNRNGSNDSTVSEGMGYAMLMAVQNNDKTTFDDLMNFLKTSGTLDANGLMNWKMDQSGIIGQGSATDADSDIAYALLLANKAWGNSTGMDYQGMAKNMISSIMKYDIDSSNPNHPVLLPGDGWGKASDNYFNPSYVDPTEWAAFAQVDTANADKWNALISQSLTELNSDANAQTGLVGNWPNQAPGGYNDPKDYGYDACRVPMRLAQYYQYLSGLEQSGQTLTPDQKNQMNQIKDLLNKEFATFAAHKSSDGGIYSGYDLSGNPNVNYGGESAFNAPLMDALNIMLKCGGIDETKISKSDAQTFLNRLQTLVNTDFQTRMNNGPDATSSNYFNGSLALLNEGWETYTPPTKF